MCEGFAIKAAGASRQDGQSSQVRLQIAAAMRRAYVLDVTMP
jgi:hypothetical protein